MLRRGGVLVSVPCNRDRLPPVFKEFKKQVTNQLTAFSMTNEKCKIDLDKDCQRQRLSFEKV